jgi:hypothetical protein
MGLIFDAGAGSSHAFTVAAAFAAAPAARSGFGFIVENPAAIGVLAGFDACGFAAAQRFRKAEHNLGHGPIPAGFLRNKLNLQSILALYHLLFTRYVQHSI